MPNVKKKAATTNASVVLTEAESQHVTTLKTEQEFNDFLLAIEQYRKRVTDLVFKPAREGQDEATRETIARLFRKVQREAGEVAAVTYVRKFFPTLDPTFFDEVEECFASSENPKVARKAMYKTQAWKDAVNETQKLVQYPLHK